MRRPATCQGLFSHHREFQLRINLEDPYWTRKRIAHVLRQVADIVRVGFSEGSIVGSKGAAGSWQFTED